MVLQWWESVGATGQVGVVSACIIGGFGLARTIISQLISNGDVIKKHEDNSNISTGNNVSMKIESPFMIGNPEDEAKLKEIMCFVYCPGK